MYWILTVLYIGLLQVKQGCTSYSVVSVDNKIADKSVSEFLAEHIENESPEDNYRSPFSRICYRYRYRTYDGSCNNYFKPEWGTPGKPYARYFNNSYSDGKHALPRSISNEPLVSPREISLKIFPDVDIKDPIWTVLTLQWGQVLAHDLSLSAGLSNAAACCSQGKYTEKEKTDPRCASIAIPQDDPFNGPAGNECYNFYRTESTDDKKKPSEPISGVTAYMDLSVVYGSSNTEARDLRLYNGGRMISEMRNGQEWLPQNHDVKSACFNVSSEEEPCYRAGDSRVNQNTLLSVLQNILLREHNRIADYLSSNNRQWNDEKCFQEARRILIAVTQHINFYEFLPILIGQENMVKNKLIFRDTEGYVNDYNSSINPAVLNEFATGAFRNYHSSIVGYLRFCLENREFNGSIRISDYMNKPSIIEEGDNFNKLSRCLSTQHQGAVDRFYTEEMTQYLLKLGDTLGQDLRSRDIQRSRDHGLETYVNALVACDLSNPTSFEDLEKYIPSSSIGLLKEVYENVKDVELIVGGALETILPETLVGPTFQCIMTEQFRRTRRGDLYFYENGQQPAPFTLRQLKSIREGSTMAGLLCNNVDGIVQMQPQAFLKIDESNALVPCSNLTQVDLSLWK